MSKPIYLDNHATTPLDPLVFEAMKPFFLENFGNASSRHEYGWAAAAAVESARKQVAQLLGALPKEIFFTSGATEANNIAIGGVLSSEKNHVITSKVEHKSVLEVVNGLEARGLAHVTRLEVDRYGQVSPEQVANAINSNTVLVTLVYGNNEIGTLNPIEKIGRVTREKNVLFHSDATQAVGHVQVDVGALGIDMLSLSAHKLHGPKGIGALYARSQNPRVKLKPFLFGGTQEMGVRPGTLNVPGIVGLGKACEILLSNMKEECQRITELRNLLQKLLLEIPLTSLNGHPTERVPHNLSITFKGINSGALLGSIHRKVALSTGSACSNIGDDVSHILKGIGLSNEDAASTLRFGLGRFTSENDIKVTFEAIKEAISKIRQS